MFLRFFLIFFLLTEFTISLNAEIDDFKVKRFTFRDGLPENEVIFMLRDNVGFLWVLTYSGVARFDGLNFYTFSKEKYPNNTIVSFRFGFQLNDDKLLFISYKNELWQYNYSTGIFSNLSKNDLFSKYKFYSGTLTQNKTLLFAVNNGLLETSIDFNRIGFYEIDKSLRNDKYLFKPSFIREDANNNFWMDWFSTGLVTFDYKKKEFFYPLNNAVNESNIFNVSFSTDKKHLIALTQFGTLLKINIKDYKYQTIPAKNVFENTSYAAFYAESFSDSQLFIGTNTGLVLLNTNNLSHKIFKHSISNSTSLTENTVKYIFKDENSLWFATASGLNFYSKVKNKFYFEQFRDIPSLSELNHEILYTFKQNNLIWYLTIKGLVVRNSLTGKSHYYLSNVSNLPTNTATLRYIIKDKDNYYWIATWGDGIIRFKLNDNFSPRDKINFEFIFSNEKDSTSLNGNYISHIYEDENSNIWISTWGSGLSFLSKEEKTKLHPKFKRFQKKYDFNILSDFIGSICSDNDKNLLMTSADGLLRYNLKQNQFDKILIDKKDPLNHINNPQFLSQDNDGGILFASFSGISKLKYDSMNNYLFEVYNIENPYKIMQIVSDIKGNIWFGSNVSFLFCYDRNKNILRRYDLSNEISGFSFGFSIPSKDDEGNIYFKSLKFNPNFFNYDNIKPKLFIRSIYVNNIERNFDADPTRIKTIQLDYDENNLKIDLSKISSDFNMSNEFRYRIRNKNSAWIALNKPELLLASVEPGNYEFEFNVSDQYGVWSDDNLLLIAKINPPYWQTAWFRILVGLLIGFIITINIRSRLKRIKNEQARIQKFTQKLITVQEEERSRVSRELHDSIGQNLLVIKNMLGFYPGKNSSSENDLDKLKNLLGESLDELRNISSSLHPHQLRRLGFKKTIQAMISKLNDSSIAGIIFHSDIEVENLNEPYDINVYRIIQESVNNVIKHSKAKNCSVIVKKNVDVIEVLIEDDGIGFETSTVGSGLGLVGIKERALLINGELIINSTNNGTIIKLIFQEK